MGRFRCPLGCYWSQTVLEMDRISSQGGVGHHLEKGLHGSPGLRPRPPSWQASGGHCPAGRQGALGAPGQLWLRHGALWWHQVDTAATLGSLHPLVADVDSRALLSDSGRWAHQWELNSIEQLVSARRSSSCFYALSHFILTCPTMISTLQMRKLRPKVSNPGSSTPD